MPLPTSAKLTPFDPARPSRELSFIESQVGSRQTRFQDRRILTPGIDLKKYRFEAVIDFVVVRVFARRTQHQWIQKELRTVLECDCWIKPINPGEGKEADEFDIKIQEPRSSKIVAAAIHAVGEKRGERRTPQLREIEFSLDVFSRDSTEDAREIMVGLLQRTYFAATKRWVNHLDMPRSTASITGQIGGEPTSNYLPPAVGEERDPSLTVRPGPEEFRSPFLDGTMYLGEKDTSGMIRIQNKVKDKQYPEKDTFDALSADQTRARVEVTLASHDLELLGLRNVRDLADFSYTKLQKKYFQFMLPTFAGVDMEKSSAIRAVVDLEERKRAAVFLKSGLLALMRSDEAWEKHAASERPEMKRVFRLHGWPIVQNRVGRGSNSTMIAYEALNKQVALAFRHLGERERRVWGER